MALGAWTVRNPSALEIALLGLIGIAGAALLQFMVQLGWAYIRQPLKALESKVDHLTGLVEVALEGGLLISRQERLARLGELLSEADDLATQFELEGVGVDDRKEWGEPLVVWCNQAEKAVKESVGSHGLAMMQMHYRRFGDKDRIGHPYVDEGQAAMDFYHVIYRRCRAYMEWIHRTLMKDA